MSSAASTTRKSVIDGLLYQPTNGCETHNTTDNAVSETSTNFDGTAPLEGRVASTSFDDLAPSSVPTTKRGKSILKKSSDFQKFDDDQIHRDSETPKKDRLARYAAKAAEKRYVDTLISQSNHTDLAAPKRRDNTGLSELEVVRNMREKDSSRSQLESKPGETAYLQTGFQSWRNGSTEK